MDPNYRASDEQWAVLEQVNDANDEDRDLLQDLADWAVLSCIIELRARIEALEAAQPPAAATEESSATAPPATDDRLRWCSTHGQQPRNAWGCPECVRELRAAAAPPAPAGGLVRRVADELCRAQLDGPSWEPEARAAIREVAAWFRLQGSIVVADVLEQEANQ